ncbi:MAG: type II toxin-antitoxin system Phd/YefM family antitoxin [Deltaproteobacteria bacterium]|nr:type II toxin-antitoxin system Phd/YefM family antitoxin [Deltaproteobacteria bacterium]
MIHFQESSILVGASELRTRLDKLLKLAKQSKIYVGKRHRPVAVLVPLEQYERMEQLYQRVEDRVLGYIARERDKNTDIKDYLPLDEAERKVGLRA